MAASRLHPRTIRKSLLASLDQAEIRVQSKAKIFGSDADEPAFARAFCTIIIPALNDHDEESSPSIEGIGLSVTEAPAKEIAILQVEAVILDIEGDQNSIESLEAGPEELRAYSCLLDPHEGDELHADLESMLSVFGRHVVILERVRLAPAWRGLGGVGRYLTGRILPLICCDPAVFAMQPFPLDVIRDGKGNAGKKEIERGAARLRLAWESIGFRPYKDDIWIMDPGSSPHEHAMAKLQSKLGLTGNAGARLS